MIRSTSTRVAGAVGLAVVLAAATASGAASGGTSTATLGALTSTAASPVLKVTGTAALAGLDAVQVGEDAAGDSPVPGTDLVSASIEPLGGGKTAFVLGIGNLAPGVGGLPAVMHHNWEFEVSNGTAVTTLSLKAINRGAVIASALEGGSPEQPSFALQTCSADPQTGQNTCTSEYVEGAYTADAVRFVVANSRIGAVSGATITPAGDGINVSPGASDVIWFNNGLGGDLMDADTYTVPEGVVKLGVAPAGTPVADVPLTTTVDVKGTAFTANLPKPAAGDNVVVAQACHDGVCGPLTSKAVTVR